MLYFSGGYQFFQMPGIKCLYDWGKEIIHLLAGRHQEVREVIFVKGKYFNLISFSISGQVVKEALSHY